MAAIKTRQTDEDVAGFLATLEPPGRREDAETLLALMSRISGELPKMWGKSIVGFGTYRYCYASGQEGDWMLTGFSPRKTAHSVYLMDGFSDYGALMKRLGKHKTGKSCLYINKLDDIDLQALEQLVTKSVATMRDRYPTKADEPPTGKAS